MSKGKNKGEWAELYTLAKLLGSGHLVCQLSERETLLKIAGVTRITKSEVLDYSMENGRISLNDSPLLISAKELLRLSVGLLHDLTANPPGAGAFESASGQELADALRIKSIKADSKTKSDILITIVDSFTQEKVRNGYSIKLIGGNDASIINASDHTRFTYEIQGIPHSVLKSKEFMARGAPAKLIPMIHENGGWLKPLRWFSDSYVENLCFVDTTMPAILAEALYQSYFCGRGRGMKKMAEIIGKQTTPPNGKTPFTLHATDNALARFSSDKRKQAWLTHKLKDFLIAHATSMNPSTPWSGEISVTGGILHVDTTTGEVINHPCYDLNGLRQKLFDGCSFDSPSTTRYKYGHIYFDKDETPLLDLVLAVRGQ